MTALLGSVLGVRGAVTKERRLFLWHGVRIHLDRVEGLGSFVELEAVASAASDLSGEHDLVRRLRADLKLADTELIAVGYAELRFGAGTPP